MYKIGALFFSVLLSGCVSFTPYEEQVPVIGYAGDSSVLVSVIDEREQVKQGKSPAFIGVYRVSFGIPVSRHVEHISPRDPDDKGSDLAGFMQRRVADGLSRAGFRSVQKPVPYLPAEVDAKATMDQERVGKWMVLAVKEWYFSSDTHFNTSFNFDSAIDLYIYDRDEGLQLSKTIEKRDVIDEHSDRHNDVLRGFKIKLTDILIDPDVRQALTR
jgi:hypothetical protein